MLTLVFVGMHYVPFLDKAGGPCLLAFIAIHKCENAINCPKIDSHFAGVALGPNRYPTTLQQDEELLLEPQHSNLGPRLQAAVAARAERKRLLHLAAQLLQEYEQRVVARSGLPVGGGSATAAA